MITKRTKVFNLGNITPSRIYELLLQIFRDSLSEPEMIRRIRLRIETHSILFEDPFVAEIRAKHGGTGFSWGERVSCKIYTEKGETLLKIESASVEAAWFDGPQHRLNIFRLYNELIFRLESERKPHLDDILSSNEKIIEQVYPVECKGIEMHCFITNSRILLGRNKLIAFKIDNEKITSISTKKEKEFRSVGYFSLAFIFLFIGLLPLTIFIVSNVINFSEAGLRFSLSVFLPIALIGTFFLIIGIRKNYVSFLMIEYQGKYSKLFAKKEILFKLKGLIQHIAIDKLSPDILSVEESSPVEVDSETRKFRQYLGSVKYQREIEKSKDLLEKANLAVAQGKLKQALKSLSEVTKIAIKILDLDMALTAVNQSIPLRDEWKSAWMQGQKQPLINLVDRIETDLRGQLNGHLISMVQKAHEKVKKGHYKAAATLFLRAGLSYLSQGNSSKAEELLNNFKRVKTYI